MKAGRGWSSRSEPKVVTRHVDAAKRECFMACGRANFVGRVDAAGNVVVRERYGMSGGRIGERTVTSSSLTAELRAATRVALGLGTRAQA